VLHGDGLTARAAERSDASRNRSTVEPLHQSQTNEARVPPNRPSLTEALVRKLRTNNELADDDIAAIERLPFTREELPPNTFIAREGDRPSRCCLLVDGFLFRAKTTEGGKRQILSFHVPGDIPDLQSLHLHVSDHDLASLNQVTVGFIPHEVLHTVTRERPRIAGALWRETLVDAALFRDWIVNVGRRPAPQRMAHLLAELARRLEAVGLMKDYQAFLPLTQVHLADALGLTSVHVNRVLQELRKDGVVDLKDRVLRFSDAERLETMAGFDPLYLHQDPKL
jgi:CRP-like cAMP-binding protein